MSKKKILFCGKRSLSSVDGVEKKLYLQIKALKALDFDVWHTYLDNNKAGVIDSKGNNIELFSFKKTLLNNYISVEKVILKTLSLEDFDVCYIRKNLTSPLHIKVLKELKNKNIKIIEEIPTYPYVNGKIKYTLFSQ